VVRVILQAIQYVGGGHSVIEFAADGVAGGNDSRDVLKGGDLFTL
jgi:hypothetical protein